MQNRHVLAIAQTIALGLCAMIAPPALAEQLDVPGLWYMTRPPEEPPAPSLAKKGQSCKLGQVCETGLVCGSTFVCSDPFAGVTSCAYGDANCNRCAYNVEAQFGQTFADLSTHLYGYRDGDLPYDNPGNHIQSFVRLPIDDGIGTNIWFAGAWGAKRDGAIIYFVDSGLSEGEFGEVRAGGEYASKIGAVTDHPGGMQGIGDYLVIAREIEGNDSDNAYFDVLKVDDPRKPARHATINLHDISGVNRVAAVGVARVSGGYLFLATRSSTPGEDGFTYLLFFAHDLRGTQMQFIGQRNVPRDAPGASENISLITECDTGSIYAVGSTADTDVAVNWWDQNVPWAVTDTGNQWVLYKVTGGDFSADLRIIAADSRPAFSSACNARAAGTAFVDRDGRLHLYCHEMEWGDHVEVGGEFMDYFNYYLPPPKK